MTEKNTHTKLGFELGSNEIVKTRVKFKLKFTDYAISNFTSNFINDKGKTLRKVATPFDTGSGKSFLKGLRLVQYQKTKSKIFELRIWLDNRCIDISLGKFEEARFGVKQCQEKLFELVRDHTNPKGHWIKNPRLTLNAANDDEKRANVEESLKLSIREVIERLCKANFPRSKREGRLSASSIQSACKVLIGYNWRTHHLIFTEDYNGHGLIRFKANYHKRTVKPEDWKDLFSKFPHGKGLIKDEKFNPNGEISVYDDVLGAEKIDNLTPGLMKRFIERNEKGFGTKKNFLEAFKCLWSFAADKGYLGDDLPSNPTLKVKFKRPEVANAPGSKYKDLRFTDQEFKSIQIKCVEKKDIYPFQAEACLMKTVTARRTEETCKFRWSMVNKDETLITLPASITKSRKVEYIDITPPVKRVIDMLKEKLKGEYQKYRFVDWMFPTTRINSKRLHEDKYVRSDQCRIKNIRGIWNSIRKDTGIFGSPTMIRTTVISMYKLELGTTSKARVLSGHEQDSTLDIHYDKHTTQQRREYANKVANVVDFAKVSNE